MKPKSKPSPDRKKIYQVAEHQAGYFTSRQARGAGYTRPLLSYHNRTDQFVRARHGIYRLSLFPEMPFADLFVAWLQVGEDSVISHESALVVYGLSDTLPSRIHVTIPRTASHRRKDLRLHTNRLAADEITRWEGLPVTTVARTLADVITSGLGEELVHQAIREAVERGLVSEKALLGYTVRRGRRVARLIHRAIQP
jgi:predicted transcriptional regulator of viral defense system